jgi:hypothetical protein
MENNEKAKEVEVVGSDVQGLSPAIVEDNRAMLTEKYVDAASRQIDLRIKLLGLALKALKPHDLQDFDGKPYLEGEGAARIMAVIRGFKVGEAKFTVEQISPHFFVECQIPMEFMSATTVALGDCSTQDSFFTGREGKGGRFGRYVEQTGSDIMAARLLLGDAKKKARENAISRGVSELLGIKGLTWDDLAQLGFSKAAAGSSVKFKTGSQNGEIKTLTVTEAVKLSKGSRFNLKAIAVDAKERVVGKDNKTITDYSIQDDTGSKMRVSVWGSCLCGVTIGSDLYFASVEATEYQGTLQYLAKEVQLVGSEGGDPNAGN